MKKIKKTQMISALLCCTLLLSTLLLSGCGAEEPSYTRKDLMTGIPVSSEEDNTAPEAPDPEYNSEDNQADPITESNEPTALLSYDSGTENIAITDFAIRLFQESAPADSNTLLSPISVLYALAMTANGAKEDTLAQMEQTFGVPMDVLNNYLHAYAKSLSSGEKYKLNIANSIWFREDDFLTVNQEFLQTNADYYNADLYQVPFDNNTLKEINAWVNESTDEMIPTILNQIPNEAIMYLINAVAFDAEWQTIYEEYDVRDGIFTKEDGSTQNIELMYSSEDRYLEDENATGFIKYYKDRKYAYVALLPKEGVSIADYAASLSGEHLNELLENPETVEVKAAIPKYESEFSIEMGAVLKNMGIKDAFDYNNADLSGIGSSTRGNLYISNVLHKTFISVDEKGTKAGAATAVAVYDCTAMAPREYKTVYLDRPFVYLLIDCENNLPIFIGTVMEIEN